MTVMTVDQAVPVRHRGMGIASFVIGIFSVVLVFGLLAVAGVLAQTGKATPETNIVLGLGIITAGIIDLVGIGLGFAGAIDRSSKKAFPALGLVLNVGIVALFSALVAIGTATGTH